MSKTKKFLCVILLLLTVAVFTFGFSNSLLRNTNVTANAATENASNEEVIQQFYFIPLDYLRLC